MWKGGGVCSVIVYVLRHLYGVIANQEVVCRADPCRPSLV